MVRRRWSLLLVLALACTACSEQGTLIVQVRTNFAPLLEMSGVGVDYAAEGTPGVWDAFVSADGSRDWRGGVRVAERSGLSTGTHMLRVGVEAPDGSVIVARPVRVEITGGTRVVTVLLTRDCESLTCPTTDPAATACLAGRCVPPECVEESPDVCGPRDCETAAECPAMGALCARSECTATGRCVEFPDDTRCASGEVCSTVSDCQPVAPADGGLDGGLDASGGDAGPGNACGPGEADVTLFGPEYARVQSRVALATDGATIAIAQPGLPGSGGLRLTSLSPARRMGPTEIIDGVTLGLEDRVDLAFGAVGTPTLPAYVLAWTNGGDLRVGRARTSDLSLEAGPFTLSDAVYLSPSLVHAASSSSFVLLVERDGRIVYTDVSSGDGFTVPTPREATAGHEPVFYRAGARFHALWRTDDAISPLHFEALDLGGATAFTGPEPLMGASMSNVEYAGAWLDAPGYAWIARHEMSAPGTVELGRHDADGTPRTPPEVELTDSRASEIRAAARPGAVGVTWLDRAGGEWRVYFVERADTSVRRVDLHTAFDAMFRSATALHVDDLVYLSGAWYVALRADTSLRLLRLCDPL